VDDGAAIVGEAAGVSVAGAGAGVSVEGEGVLVAGLGEDVPVLHAAITIASADIARMRERFIVRGFLSSLRGWGQSML
jgi:hypothetical protein